MKGKFRTTINLICVIGIILLGWSAYLKLNTPNYDEMGKAAYNNGNFSKAIEFFEMAIKHNPRNADAYWNLGNTYAHEDTYFHHYNKLPHQTYVQAGLKDQENAFENAVNDFKKAMKIDPSYAAISHFGLGNAYYDYYDLYNDTIDYAIPQYKAALKDPSSIVSKLGKIGLAMVYTNLGRAYLHIAELNDAYKAYKKALSIYPVNIAMEHLTPVCLELGRYNEAYKIASDYIKKARSEHSDELDLALMPGAFAAFKLGKYDEVIDYTSEIIKKFPDSDYVAEAHRLRAMVYRIKGNEKQTEDDLSKAIAMCSDQIKSPGSPADIPGAYYERGLDYYNLGEYQKAANDFQYLINHPKVSDREVAHENYFLESHVALASVYSKLGKNNEATKLLQETLNILSTDPELQGWNRYVREDIEKLLEEVKTTKSLGMPIGLCQFLGK